MKLLKMLWATLFALPAILVGIVVTIISAILGILVITYLWKWLLLLAAVAIVAATVAVIAAIILIAAWAVRVVNLFSCSF